MRSCFPHGLLGQHPLLCGIECTGAFCPDAGADDLPARNDLRPLYTARALHLPLSLAIFTLLLPEQEAEVFSTLPARVILMRQLPPDCAVLLLVGCSFAVCQLTNLLLQRDFQETSPGNLDSSRLL